MSGRSLGKMCSTCGVHLLDINKSGKCNHHRDRTGANNPMYGKRNPARTVEQTQAASDTAKKLWQMKEYRDKVIAGAAKPRRAGFGAEQSKRVTEWYKNNPEQRTLRSERMKKSWETGAIVVNEYANSNESKKEIEFKTRLLEICSFLEKKTIRFGVSWIFPDVVSFKDGAVIEFYGDYWHANPDVYCSTSIVRDGLTAGQIWDRDEKRVGKLESLGFNVFVVWERDWKTDKMAVLRKFDMLFNWEGCAL